MESHALDAEAPRGPLTLAPVLLPGGLGAHKWRDRRLLAELERRIGAVPLLTDLDGDVLEAAWANVFVVEGTTLTTPPLDGRLLRGTVRARLLAFAPAIGLEPREEPLSLERLAAADEFLLSSSVQGVRAAVPPGGRRARFVTGARLQQSLLDSPQPLEVP
jgi:para-aminobenzoate synthetase/4-amino-4-deoxychorismate lyase